MGRWGPLTPLSSLKSQEAKKLEMYVIQKTNKEIDTSDWEYTDNQDTKASATLRNGSQRNHSHTYLKQKHYSIVSSETYMKVKPLSSHERSQVLK